MDIESFKKGTQSIENYFESLKKNYQVKQTYQDVSIEQVESVLKKIGNYSIDKRDVVWCLLNNELPSLFPGAEKFKLSDGASIAHIGSYVGILIRGKTKLDREGRDYWIKPLRDIGAIEALTFSAKKEFVPGHIKAKSPNSCYKLNPSFVALLQAYGKSGFGELFVKWISSDEMRQRLEIQAVAEDAARYSVQLDSHQYLIQQSIDIYAKFFLPDFIVVYKDDADGDRVSKEEKELMDRLGIVLELEDAYPDVILHNKTNNSLWFIEAVTSDGEVDEHKIKGLFRICKKSNMQFSGATTTYLYWRTLAARQQRNKNLANNSMIWILEDPQKQYQVNYYKK